CLRSRRSSSSLRALSARRGSSFLRSSAGAGAATSTGASAAAGAGATTGEPALASISACALRRASSSARWRASSSAFRRAASSAARCSSSSRCFSASISSALRLTKVFFLRTSTLMVLLPATFSFVVVLRCKVILRGSSALAPWLLFRCANSACFSLSVTTCSALVCDSPASRICCSNRSTGVSTTWASSFTVTCVMHLSPQAANCLLEPMGSGGHDQLAGTLFIDAVYLEQVVNRLLGQVFTGDDTPHCQLDRQFLVHAFQREQIFSRLSVRQFLFSSDRLGQQAILGACTQLIDDVFIKAIDAEHFFHRNVGNFLKGGETFLHQNLRKLFIDVQLFDEETQNVAGFFLLLGLNVVLGHHVQGPASQLAGQPYVLTAATDCLRQVVFRDSDIHRVSIFINDDRSNLCRSHCIDDELRGIFIPQHDIDTLATNLAGDCLDARTAHADAGALRVDTLVLGAHRNLGSRTRITRSAHDLDQLLGDFRHFDAEQLD